MSKFNALLTQIEDSKYKMLVQFAYCLLVITSILTLVFAETTLLRFLAVPLFVWLFSRLMRMEVDANIKEMKEYDS